MIGKFSREKLHDYPPRIVCRFFPEQGAVSTTCTLSLHGFDTPVSVNMALEGFDKPVSVNMALLTPQRSVDTKQLKVFHSSSIIVKYTLYVPSNA